MCLAWSDCVVELWPGVLRNKARDILYHTEERIYFACTLSGTISFDGVNLPGVWLDSLGSEDMTIKHYFDLEETALFLVEPNVVLLVSFKYSMYIFVMLFLIFPIDYNAI